LKLPALDALAKQSISADNATSPTGATLTSIPSLIMGKFVNDSHEVSSDDLRVDLEDGEKGVSWVTQPTLFSEAYEAGHNVAVVGWYVPYCRIFSAVLSKCSAYGFYDVDSDHSSLKHEIARQLKRVSSIRVEFLRSYLGQKFGMSWIEPRTNREWVLRFKKILSDVRSRVVDRSNDVVYVHFSIPHFPIIYDRQKAEFSESGNGTYLDNLVLVDRALGEIMGPMKDAGVWDDTAVLVSSDHWFRFRADEAGLFVDGKNVDRHVPFLLKMPGRNRQVVFHKPFNTILSKDLLLSILEREVETPSDAVTWIERHATDHPPLTGPSTDRLSSHHAP
jgi:hypothetical protein